jgi:hypothetical protein
MAMTEYPPRVVESAPLAIPPPPKVNPSFAALRQPTQLLPMRINRNRPHQSTREMQRRRKQFERAKGKR